MKPVYGGIEISVRYITRANERFAVRTKLYQSAVDLLGKRALPIDPPQPPAQPPAPARARSAWLSSRTRLRSSGGSRGGSRSER